MLLPFMCSVLLYFIGTMGSELLLHIDLLTQTLMLAFSLVLTLSIVS